MKRKDWMKTLMKSAASEAKKDVENGVLQRVMDKGLRNGTLSLDLYVYNMLEFAGSKASHPEVEKAIRERAARILGRKSNA